MSLYDGIKINSQGDLDIYSIESAIALEIRDAIGLSAAILNKDKKDPEVEAMAERMLKNSRGHWHADYVTREWKRTGKYPV